MFATIALITIMMAGTVVLQHQSTWQTQASPDALTMYVDPSVYHAKAVNETFSVDIKVSNVLETMKIVAWDFKLRYNKTFIQYVSGKNGSFFDAVALPPNGTALFISPIVGNDGWDNASDFVWCAGMLFPDANGQWHSFPSGSATLYTLTFKAIYEPTSIVPNNVTFDFILFPARLADSNANTLPHEVVNGHYDIGPFIGIEPAVYHAKAVNETFSINVTIGNVVDTKQLGGFGFRLYYDTTVLSVVSVKNGSFLDRFAGPVPPNGGTMYLGPIYGHDKLGDYVGLGGMILPDSNGVYYPPYPSGSGTLATITFKNINASGASNLTFAATYLVDIHGTPFPHNYWPTQGYVDTVIPVPPTLIGDIDGNGIVDIFDAIKCGSAFGSKPGDANWNALADLNHDNVVDIFDAIMLGAHFGQTS
jgi:hypothetical protein